MKSNATQPPGWIQQIRARGLGPTVHTALDVLEPLGPLGAQMVWIAQPLFGLFVPTEALDDLARALEEPGGVDRLRGYLDND
jgi:hypothetical protein